MKTTENIISKTLQPFSKRFTVARSTRGLVAAIATFLGILCTPVYSQSNVYSLNIVGCVSKTTIELLTAPVTTVQLQVLHAQHFNRLAPTNRPLYLHAVAFAVGYSALNGQAPTSDALQAHLVSVSSIYAVAAIPPEDSQSLSVFLAVVHTALSELNVLIGTQVANNAGYRQAMYAGAVDGFFNTELLSLN